jgi:putative methylase
MLNKKQLVRVLDKLDRPKVLDINLEQYTTPAEVAAEVVWQAYMKGDIQGKTVMDVGCGNGILGIAALLLGAKSLVFVDIDKGALDICKQNIEHSYPEFDICNKSEFIQKDVRDLKRDLVKESNTVLMNPPFGTKIKHADRAFLEKVIVCNVIYSFHKTTTEGFVEAFVEDNGKTISDQWDFKYPLYQTYSHHEKKKVTIEVSVFRIA